MEQAGIKIVGDIYAISLALLEVLFGSYGGRLFDLARGIDHSPVVANRQRKQVSAEETFPEDIALAKTEAHIRALAEKVWKGSQQNARGARTVVLKLKTREFTSLTRSHTPTLPLSSCAELVRIALALRERVTLGPTQLFRLVGVGLSNFQEDEVAPFPLFGMSDEEKTCDAESAGILQDQLVECIE